MKTDKALLLRWCGWFFMGNALLLWMIGSKYLTTIPWLDTRYIDGHAKTMATIFIALGYFGQFVFISFLPCLFIIPLIFLFPKRKLIFATSILSAVGCAVFLCIDATLYNIYHFHLNGLMLSFVVHDIAMFGFALKEYLEFALIIFAVIFVESLYAFWLWRRIDSDKSMLVPGHWLAIISVMFLTASYGMIFFTKHAVVINRVLIDEGRMLPLYTETLGLLLSNQGMIAVERMSERYCLQPKQVSKPLQYPLHLMQCKAPAHPLNIVIIGIDAWRFDMLNPSVVPSIYAFSKKSWDFTHHSSGGNATGPGVFSLFYGLPATYWTSMETQHRGPVFFQQLIKNHYQMRILSSGELDVPPLSRTVFRDVPDLFSKNQPGKSPFDRDRSVTQKFKKFITKDVDLQHPFFSFLLYDSAHTYCYGSDNLKPLKPTTKQCDRFTLSNKTNPVPYLNRYKNSLLFIDQQVQQVLAMLQSRHLLENTVVIITGDHGEEFNDNHLNYWGHASNYTRYQVQTPLIIYWPDKPSKEFSYQTNHYDLVPTLLKQVLNCTNPSSDYSAGSSLLNYNKPPFLIVGSYINFGVIEPDKITTIYQAGNYQITNLEAKPALQNQLNIAVMQRVFSDLQRFYKA